jgi:hypothetical protein
LWRAVAANLDLIFALQFERTVNQDNTISVQNLRFQIEAVRWRGTLAGCNVTAHQHLDGSFSLPTVRTDWAATTLRARRWRKTKHGADGLWKSRVVEKSVVS